jgi:ketosteroid isomerase-like protein
MHPELGEIDMMHPNEDLLRRSYEVDLPAFGEMLADDVAIHVGGDSPLAGHHRGKPAALGFFRRAYELSGGTLRQELHDVLANDDHAIGLQVTRAERLGRRLEARQVLVCHLRDGKFQEAWLYSEDQPAVDAFWS